MQDGGFNSFASNVIKLSVNETKWSSLLARTRALILFISIWIFDFGPEKLPGLSSNGPLVRFSVCQLRHFSGVSPVFFTLFRRSVCSYVKSLALSSYRFISIVLIVVVLFNATVGQSLQFSFAVILTIFRMLVQFCIISVVFCDRVSFFLPNHISMDFSVLNSSCIRLYPTSDVSYFLCFTQKRDVCVSNCFSIY